MPFTPANPHLTVALVLGGHFGQFADPLDWIARSFELDVRVDRQLLMESLAVNGGGVASKARAEAAGSDKRTKFRIELFGRCQGQLVALCGITFSPVRLPLKTLEERAIDLVVLNPQQVLGVQATAGKRPESLDGLITEDPLLRLLPVNIFSRAFFREKLDLIDRDRKIKLLDAGDAAVIQLAKPWLFYDVPMSNRKKRPQNLLPF
jgi:hypothetical protein